ncbi:hypothetical protein PHYSODRAFT_380487, partial [Phytophthora sojae]
TAALEAAGKYGHVSVLQCLLARLTELNLQSAMYEAAKNGKLEVVKWLIDRRGNCRRCTTQAMDVAASNGHLDVLKWLHENRKEGCTKFTMGEAAANGHLDVVKIKWLHANRLGGCTTKS